MTEIQRPKEIIYICLDGKFVPTHLMQKPLELGVYLDGYSLSGNRDNYATNQRLTQVFNYGEAMATSNGNHLRKQRNETYAPRKLRESKPFQEGLIKDDISMLGATIPSKRNIFAAPAWAFPNHSETSE
jgi:hypothetical protein